MIKKERVGQYEISLRGRSVRVFVGDALVRERCLDAKTEFGAYQYFIKVKDELAIQEA